MSALEIISRKNAMALGLKRYFTGRPCKSGRLEERDISGTCIECNRVNKAIARRISSAYLRLIMLSL